MRSIPQHLRRQQSGFTLVEVTVALVLTSMLAGLLASALYFAARTRVAVSTEMQEQLQRHINFNRFEQVVGYCLPGVGRTEVALRGTASTLECMSMQSLSPTPLPAPVRIKFAITEAENGQALLQYADEVTGLITIAKLPSPGRFVYWGSDGKPQAQWLLGADQEQWLPRKIEIQFDSQSQQNGRWSAALRVTPQPELNPPSLFGTTLQ